MSPRASSLGVGLGLALALASCADKAPEPKWPEPPPPTLAEPIGQGDQASKPGAAEGTDAGEPTQTNDPEEGAVRIDE